VVERRELDELRLRNMGHQLTGRLSGKQLIIWGKHASPRSQNQRRRLNTLPLLSWTRLIRSPSLFQHPLPIDTRAHAPIWKTLDIMLQIAVKIGIPPGPQKGQALQTLAILLEGGHRRT
jgi:hypothetical protein